MKFLDSFQKQRLEQKAFMENLKKSLSKHFCSTSFLTRFGLIFADSFYQGFVNNNNFCSVILYFWYDGHIILWLQISFWVPMMKVTLLNIFFHRKPINSYVFFALGRVTAIVACGAILSNFVVVI
jgi:hypothetical protein